MRELLVCIHLNRYYKGSKNKCKLCASESPTPEPEEISVNALRMGGAYNLNKEETV